MVLVSGEDLLGEEVDTAEGLSTEGIRSDRISDVYIYIYTYIYISLENQSWHSPTAILCTGSDINLINDTS